LAIISLKKIMAVLVGIKQYLIIPDSLLKSIFLRSLKVFFFLFFPLLQVTFLCVLFLSDPTMQAAKAEGQRHQNLLGLQMELHLLLPPFWVLVFIWSSYP